VRPQSLLRPASEFIGRPEADAIPAQPITVKNRADALRRPQRSRLVVSRTRTDAALPVVSEHARVRRVFLFADAVIESVHTGTGSVHVLALKL